MRINTDLQASRLKKWVEALLLLMVCLVLLVSGMPYLAIALSLILMLFVLFYQQFWQKPSAYLVRLIQFDKQTWRWSVYEPKRMNKSILQEGRLLGVHRWFFVLVMRFETIERNKSVIQSWVIWRDQVDADHWRRLIVISRFWASDVHQMKANFDQKA